MKASVLAVFVSTAPVVLAADGSPERRWDVRLEGFFDAGKNPLSVYARERDGRWIAGVGSSIIPGSNRCSFNKAYHWVDMSQVSIVEGKMKGPLTIRLIPDFWVPFNHQSYTVEVALEASVAADEKIDGSYTVTAVNTSDRSRDVIGKAGRVSAVGKLANQPVYPGKVMFTLCLSGALVGGKPEYGERFIVLRLGCDGGKLASVSVGRMGTSKSAFVAMPGAPIPAPPAATVHYDADGIAVKIKVPDDTLDGEKTEYVFDIKGQVMERMLVGLYKVSVEVAGKVVEHEGGFYGSWDAWDGAVARADDRPWNRPVEGFKPIEVGEHPRLLFRKSDLPALRKRAETATGKAIIARLRQTLDGRNGDGMPVAFNPTVGPVNSDDSSYKAPLGAFTISHVAGYGLLYQITGDQKYADLGRQCFEKALAGYRDADTRYSFKAPYGAHRAGPSLGWMAVGYDLCYDGWDAVTREKFGRELIQYNGSSGTNEALDIETLARGGKPPASNHFGLEVGGPPLACMAVMGEPWADQKRIDGLLKICERSLSRNLSEGFGDGGFFAEGDGTGSMSSQIVFLSALGAWKNVFGRDWINVERPNARMTTLKWIYLTIVRDGQPDFPKRGGYPHNVWARHAISGAGYFAIGMGSVTDEQKAALLWYYNHYLRAADEKAGVPFDTVCPYPHLSVCAFLNWPIGVQERNPAEVLPLCYRDSLHGFYAWRNRWQDDDDIAISLYQATGPRGFISAGGGEGCLKVSAFGKEFDWGRMDPSTRFWLMSPRGETSVLTTAGGVSVGVDFTRASGAEAMLVTSGSAEGQKAKLGDVELTFKFLCKEAEPIVRIEGATAVAGRQKVSWKDGNIVFAVARRQ